MELSTEAAVAAIARARRLRRHRRGLVGGGGSCVTIGVEPGEPAVLKAYGK